MLVFSVWQFGFPLHKKGGAPTNAPAKVTLEYQRQRETIEQDSDNDGLNDWEEVLWKTNSKNPDTDGDGTLDGAEVQENRNPTVVGPKDEMVKTLLTAEKQIGGVTPEQAGGSNLTRMMGEQLGREYLKQKQASGGTLTDPQQITNVIANMLSASTVADVDPFTFEDIHIVADSKETTKELIISTANILQETFVQFPTSELEALHQIGEVSPELNSKIIASVVNPYITAYNEAEKELLRLTVPRTYARAFVVFLNTLEKMKQSLIAIRQADNDPALSFTGFKEYLRAQEGFAKIIQETQIQLVKDGIRFSPQELGMAAQFLNL